MKRIAMFVGVLLLANAAFAQQFPLTGRDRDVFRSLFRSGNYGPPRYAAAPVACATATKGITWYDTANDVVRFCNGSSYVSTSAYAGTTLVPVVSTDLGATATPFRNLYLYGAGTFATTYLKLTGTPTSTRTVTFPDATDTVAELGVANAFTANNTFAGTSTATGTVILNTSVQGTMTAKALTESSATAFVTATVATSSRLAGLIQYSVEANDASDFQVRGGVIPFTAVNKAGTITCTVGTVTTATEVVSVSSGTLTNTFTCADGTSGVLNLLANAASSLTQTTLQIRYRVETIGTSTLTPQ